MRVLHLIQLQSGRLTLSQLATLGMLIHRSRRAGRVEHACVTMGSAMHARTARRCGLRPLHHLTSTHTLAGMWSLRHLLATMDRPDTMVFWGTNPRLPWGRLLPVPRVIYASNWLAGQHAGNPIARLCLHGVPDDAPGLWLEVLTDPQWIDLSQREALRERWGVRGASDQVLMLLSEPIIASDAYEGIYTMGVACRTAGNRLGRSLQHHLLVHPLQHRRNAAERLLDRYGGGWSLTQDADTAAPWRVLAGCDIGLCLEADGGAALTWAASAGLPCIAMDSPANRYRIQHLKSPPMHWFEMGKPRRAADLLHAMFSREPVTRSKSQSTSTARGRISSQQAALDRYIPNFRSLKELCALTSATVRA